ncbi:hypothetical protein G9A89_000224, partial [Geosiphon pyriformis]
IPTRGPYYLADPPLFVAPIHIDTKSLRTTGSYQISSTCTGIPYTPKERLAYSVPIWDLGKIKEGLARSLWQKLYSYAILLVWSPLTPFCTSQVFLHPITTHDLALTYEDNFRTDLVTMDDGTRVLLIQDFFEGPSYLIYNLHTQYTYLSIGNTTYAQRPQ